MRTKKYRLFLLLFLVVLLFCSACVSPDPEPGGTNRPGVTQAPAQKQNVKVAALKGPTGIGMVKLMKDQEAGDTANNYSFALASSPDEITGKLVSGEIHVAALPTNLALNLYNKTNGKVQLAALNTLGVLSILEKGNTIASLADLEGKIIYATGQGAIPEYVLDYILKSNDIHATVEYVTEHAELATLALSGRADVVMLPEPFVTTVLQKDADFRIALDVTEAFQSTCEKNGKGGTTLTMGCLVVNSAFAAENQALIRSFLEEYQASADYVVNQVPVAAKWVVEYGIMGDSELAEQAIPNCNIVYVDGDEMIQKIAGLYQLLFDYNPASIGGDLPDEGFYYHK